MIHLTKHHYQSMSAPFNTSIDRKMDISFKQLLISYMRKFVQLFAWFVAAACLCYLVLLSSAPYPPHIDNNNNNYKIQIEKNIQKLYHNSNLSNIVIDRSWTEADRYLIRTPKCTIRRFPLFDSDTIRLFNRSRDKNSFHGCNQRSLGDKIHRMNGTAIRIPSRLKRCNAKEIIRWARRDLAKFGRNFGPITGRIANFAGTEAVQIDCEAGVSRIVPLIPVRKPNRWPSVPGESGNFKRSSINVIMIGIDAVSRLNFRRHFTETLPLLERNGFVSMLGYHKVGDNTLPNLFAMMLGETQREWMRRLPQNHRLDTLPFVFKRYSNAGYLTSFIEDYPYCGLFNFHGMNGFAGPPPTEYYLRPVNLRIRENGLYEHMMCYGDRLEMELYYDFVLDQFRTFRKRGNQKHLTWIHQSTVSHEALNLCQYADRPLSRLLATIFNENFHKNSLIMLYSDHAIRIGPILETDSGYHETRLPFLFVYVPDSLRIDSANGDRSQTLGAAEIRAILAQNSRRLTSHMDVHATLRHIVEGRPPADEKYGKSLFTSITENRTCSDAGIPAQYCICDWRVSKDENEDNSSIDKTIDDNRLFRSLALIVIDEINHRLLPIADRCVRFRLARISTGQIIQSTASNQSKNNNNNNSSKVVIVSLIFSVKIDDLEQMNLVNIENDDDEVAKFETYIETTLDSSSQSSTSSSTSINDMKRTSKIIDKISRVDHYAEKAFCVTGNESESFCYCRELLQSKS